MHVFLKVKIKSLADEARIIKHEEQKRRGPRHGPGPERFWLHSHRVFGVRPEARCALIAYGFLRGRPYEVVENNAKTQPDWERVQKLVEKFGEDDVRHLRQRFSEWCPSEGSR